jgi:signal transduction histidine kinase
MVVEGEVLGVLSLESRQLAGFNEEDETLIETLAMATAQVLARMKHAQTAARSTAVVLLGAQGAEMSHEMGHMIRAMRHQIYKLKTQNQLEAKQLPPLELIEEEMDRARGLIDLPPLPDLRDPNTYPDVGDSASLHETIQREAKRIRERTDPNNPRKWRLHYHFASQSPQIAIHPEWLRVIIRHLSRNALNAMPQGGDLTFSTEIGGEQVIVRVSDTGAGFRPEIAPFLFRERIPHPDGDRRRGLGLLLVALVVEAHGGVVRLESTQLEQGSCVLFTLPKVKRPTGEEADRAQV